MNTLKADQIVFYIGIFFSFIDCQKEMKKEFFKTSNSYTISVIDTVQPENGRINPIKEIDLENKKSNKSEGEVSESSDFESAIKSAGYGKFNWLFLFATSWGFIASVNDTTSISMILPSAQCDLNLSDFDKGMLNAVIYIGMTLSAFFWGLLSDATGRKIILIIGFSLDAFFSTAVGLVQNFTLLLIAKLFSGFICSGLMAILTSYMAETHSHTYRRMIIVYSRIFTAVASFGLSFSAWLIIPREIRIVLFNGYISLPSWRIFLLVSAIPSALAVIGLLFLDESPKFLMFQGNNKEALRVLKRIYKMNTGKPKNTFPIKRLKNEVGSIQQDLRQKPLTLKRILSTVWKQIVPIFHKPHLLKALLPSFIQFFGFFGMNTIRLWAPQLFTFAVNTEKYGYNFTAPSTICDLLEHASRERDFVDAPPCSPVENRVYFNSMIAGIVPGFGFLIFGYILKVLENKSLMILAYSLSVVCCFGFYWSNTSNILLGVVSTFTALMSSASTALISVVIDIFPTSLRTSAVSLCLTFGLLGAMTGNIVFPVLLNLSCTAPFILLAVIILGAAGLAIFLPNTKGKDLE